MNFKITDVPVKGHPLDPLHHGEMIKPGELIDIVELSPLTLSDRRIYNLLIANAWPNITEKRSHRIHKSALKGSHYGNERLEESTQRLMGAIAIIKMRKDGRNLKRRVQLLGPNDEELKRDGLFTYRFPDELISIIKTSEIFARLKSQIMYSFESKYSLCLYEAISKRVGLKYTQHEDFSISQIRSLLNVPKDKLLRFADLNKYCLKPALREVNSLSDFSVEISPIKKGRQVQTLRLIWLIKDDDGKFDAMHEVEQHRSRRPAHLARKVERITYEQE